MDADKSSTPVVVAPLVGAWIEITCALVRLTTMHLSLLSWERGLKSNPQRVLLSAKKSLLSWERGLKYFQ